MIEGVKVRGSDTGLNLILIDSKFHKVTPDLVTFEIITGSGEIPNINYIGYSKYHKQLFIQMRNDKRYIYQNVPVEKWQIRHNYAKLNEYYQREIKGISFFETDQFVKQISNQYVLEAYNKLEYLDTIRTGLWAT